MSLSKSSASDDANKCSVKTEDSTSTAAMSSNNLVVRNYQNSDENLQILFDSVLNPSESKRPLQQLHSQTYRQRLSLQRKRQYNHSSWQVPNNHHHNQPRVFNQINHVCKSVIRVPIVLLPCKTYNIHGGNIGDETTATFLQQQTSAEVSNGGNSSANSGSGFPGTLLSYNAATAAAAAAAAGINNNNILSLAGGAGAAHIT
ncbi:Transcriptional coactivator yorkie [Eumeta japonica]|uniref:Transcriptional coactivator yorkie n=1 Tax=Eumeta variegata TaxID=151549 RepID=A0A4C1SMY7_EUMVA|nr:Transcriptional coactivator yorkie [Eumeta japonica]